jgi:hypothetical protein
MKMSEHREAARARIESLLAAAPVGVDKRAYLLEVAGLTEAEVVFAQSEPDGDTELGC